MDGSRYWTRRQDWPESSPKIDSGQSFFVMEQQKFMQSDLGAFLRAELAGVDLEGVALESVPVVRWQSTIHSRSRAIAGYRGGTQVPPAPDDVA
jgi:hypothetical protein